MPGHICRKVCPISIHSAIASGDEGLRNQTVFAMIFQSTPLSLAETTLMSDEGGASAISIHSAIASGDGIGLLI